MEIEFEPQQTPETKINIGLRVSQKEYDFIYRIAAEHKVSIAHATLVILRSALKELKVVKSKTTHD